MVKERVQLSIVKFKYYLVIAVDSEVVNIGTLRRTVLLE